MATYTVQNLENDLIGILHGTTLSQVQNLNGVLWRAARDVLQDVDPQETKRTIQLVPVYPYVYDYPCMSDLKGNKITDVAPQTPRFGTDIFTSKTPQYFDVNKSNSGGFLTDNMFTVAYNTGAKTLRLNLANSASFPSISSPLVISSADLVSGANGTWSTTGNATNLTTDYQNSFTGTGSLMFNIAAGGGTAGLVNSTLSPVNISTAFGQLSLFLETYLDVPSAFSSVTVRIGSSPANYYQAVVTQTQEATAFTTGWNLLSALTSAMATVGNPIDTAITYLAVTWQPDAAAHFGIRLNNVVMQTGIPLNVSYFSDCMFQNAQTLAFQQTVTDPSNLINLGTDSYNLMTFKSAYFIAQQLQGIEALFFDATFFQNLYAEALAKYKVQYKSDIQKQQTTYYQKNQSGYSTNYWYPN